MALITGVLAASASATVLCKAPENPECLTEKEYPFRSLFKAKLLEGTESSFVTPSITRKCKESTVELEILEGTPLPVEVTAVTFANCEGCTILARNLPYLGDIAPTKSWSGTLTLKPREGANPSVKIDCSGVVCIYGAEEMILTLVPGSIGKMVSPSAPLKLEQGFGCPQEGTWSALYEFEVPMYVV